MHKLTRKQFLETLSGTFVTAAVSSLPNAAAIPKSGIKLGVTLYSYTGEYGSTTMLEECVADAAGIGAEGIEIVSETHIPNYPEPSGKWVERWHELMEKYHTRPSCYVCSEASRISRNGASPANDSVPVHIQDLRLANRLGFKVLQPAWGPITSDVMTGSSWKKTAQKSLRYAEKYDVKIAPAIDLSSALQSRLIDTYLDLIDRTDAKHLGLTLDLGECVNETARGVMDLLARNRRALAKLVPYTLHVRGRFRGPYVYHLETGSWQIADGNESPVAGMIPDISRGGYEGYISSEYEGPRNSMIASNRLRLEQAQLKLLLERA
jgi:sugar phosphate isomerase/epimerase